MLPESDHPQRPKASAIIVNYETSNLVARCVASLVRQSVPVEIIVVDNPSPKGDVQNLEALPVLVVRNRENIGYGRACNQGAKIASADFICILNPDTVLPDDSIATWIDLFRRESAKRRIGVLAPRLLNENGTVQRSAYGFLNAANYWFYHSIFAGALKKLRKMVRLAGGPPGGVKQVDWVMGAAMLIPREAWNAVDGFGENYFLYAEDTDLCRRLHERGYEVLYAPEVSVIHTQGEPAPERRHIGAVRLFTGIRTFIYQHFGPVRRKSIEACVILDMTLRIGLFGPLSILRPGSVIVRNRLRGAVEILRIYTGARADRSD